MRWLFVTVFILTTALIFLSKKIFLGWIEYGYLVNLMCLGYNNQNDYWRIQCQMMMGAAPVPQNRNTRKRRKKIIGKRRKNESISLPSQMRVRTQNDESPACSTFSSHKTDTVAKDERTVEEGRAGETPGGKGCGVPGAGSHLPSREDASCVLPGASSGHAWLQAGELFPLCSSLLIPVGPNSLEMPRAGRPDEGSLWGAAPGAAVGSTSRVELLV